MRPISSKYKENSGILKSAAWSPTNCISLLYCEMQFLYQNLVGLSMYIFRFLQARYVVFVPEKTNSYIAMRVELYGCPVSVISRSPTVVNKDIEVGMAV